MQKALFLDRDGVINIEKNYLHKINDFEFIEGIFDLCNCFQNLGYQIFVVTNQSGIARGYYTEQDFEKLSVWMKTKFQEKDINITDIFHCPHHPDISGKCECRKPNPGMLLKAAKIYNIDLKNSIIIGDKERDIEAGLNAGLQESYLYDESGTVLFSKAIKIVNKLEDIWINKC